MSWIIDQQQLCEKQWLVMKLVGKAALFEQEFKFVSYTLTRFCSNSPKHVVTAERNHPLLTRGIFQQNQDQYKRLEADKLMIAGKLLHNFCFKLTKI